MENIWVQAKAILKDKIEKSDYESWVNPIEFAEFDGETLRLKTENNFFKRWFIDHYLDQTRIALQSISTGDIRVVLESDEAQFADNNKNQMTFGDQILGQPEPKPVRKKSPGRPPKLPSAGLNHRYTFDSFIEGPSNQLARAACLSVAKKPGRSFNPLFMYGGTGLGKTHLINAIGNQMLQKNAEATVVALSSEKFMNEMISAIHHNRVNSFRNKYRNCDCLLIDDIQFLSGKERTQEEFFHTFNTLYESGSQIVLTSDRVPKDIPGIEHRLRTRFGWGLVADIQPPELETRMAILRDLSLQEQINLPDDVTFFLASKFDQNVRDLQGAFIRLVAYSSFNGHSITLDMAKKVLRNMIEENEEVITVDIVQRKVCEYFKVKMNDLKSQRRQRIIAVPRQIGMYLSRKMTDSSYPDIGQQFGGRDHSTVIHACNKIEKQSKDDNTLQRTLETIEKTIRG